MINSTETIVKEETLTLEEILETSNLIVHNDEVNTFDWVIETLVSVCKHTFEQAEQCSMLVHYKGKAAVKNGSLEELKPFKDAICERGINATIE
jgi:ATP-dependent Clp protease adaptor protein ClpS